MRDLNRPWLIYAKAALLLAGGVLASGALILEHPTVKAALLLALSVWCFARAYYFAFYVIERYVDPSYRFAGLLSLARYLHRRRRGAR